MVFASSNGDGLWAPHSIMATAVCSVFCHLSRHSCWVYDPGSIAATVAVWLHFSLTNLQHPSMATVPAQLCIFLASLQHASARRNTRTCPISTWKCHVVSSASSQYSAASSTAQIASSRTRIASSRTRKHATYALPSRIPEVKQAANLKGHHPTASCQSQQN